MMISFGIVLLILARYGFPVILKAVEKRKNYIEASLVAAREAQEELGKVVQTGERMLAEARRDQHAILKETTRLKEQLIEGPRRGSSRIGEDAGLSARRLKPRRRRRCAPSGARSLPSRWNWRNGFSGRSWATNRSR